ncbi:MAG TPA: hypothetical protein VFC53_00160 [Dehalococcoidia bacterium]|nr:hypothetical protein [Dehalococcoidia bacterium]
MPDRALDAVCRDCGRALSLHDGTAPARCGECFDGFLRARDAAFLSSYSELGVTSRRVVAETCLRALVMESPPARKVLAMTVMEQYAQAAGDLIGLWHALKARGREPIMRTFLDFRLDRASALAFFREVASTPGPELLDALGLPRQEQIPERFASLSKSDARDLDRAVHQLLADLRKTVDMGEAGALALAQMAGERRAGAAMTHQSAWLDNVGLRPDQVAAIALDERRHTVNVTAISVDERKLQNMVNAIDTMTRASQNLIYAVLTQYQEEERAGRADPARRPRPQ